MPMTNILCKEMAENIVNNEYISRIDACYMLGVSRTWIRSLEVQNPAMEAGYSRFFPELSYRQKMLTVYKFTKKVTFYNKKEINELHEVLSRLRTYKLKMERNRKNPEYNKAI